MFLLEMKDCKTLDPLLTGIRKGATGNIGKSQNVPAGAMAGNTHDNLTKAFQVFDLCIEQNDKLLPAIQCLCIFIVIIGSYNLCEIFS